MMQCLTRVMRVKGQVRLRGNVLMRGPQATEEPLLGQRRGQDKKIHSKDIEVLSRIEDD